MKCGECGTDNAANAITCRTCNSTLDEPARSGERSRPLRSPVRSPPGIGESSPTKPLPQDEKPKPTPSPSPEIPPRAPLKLAAPQPAAPSTAEPPPAPAIDPSPRRTPPPAAESASPFDPTVEFEPVEEELIQAYVNPDWQIVSVIGFAQGGKSFFVNRLRYELRLRDWVVNPAYELQIPTSPDGIIWTDIHSVRRGKIVQKYLLADCAGESFGKRRADLTNRELTKFYTSAIGLADAYVFVIPTELVTKDGVVGERLEIDDAELSALRRDFAEIVRTIVGAKARVAEETGMRSFLRGRRKAVMQAKADRAGRFLTAGLGPQDLRAAFNDTIMTSTPVFIAFTQADKLVTIETHDEDPFLFALRYLNDLTRLVVKHFRRYRFDFVSAFVESAPKVPDYGSQSWGAIEVFEWIHGALRSRANSAWAATEIRRRLDPEFRALLENAPEVRR